MRCWAVVALLAFGGCWGDPDYTVFLGVLNSPTSEHSFDFPSRVYRGQPFELKIFTFGAPCAEFHATDVPVEQDGVHIWVWDRYYDDVCFDGLAIAHPVQLTLGEPGTITFHVHGRVGDEVVEAPFAIYVE